MKKGLAVIFLAALIVIPLAIFGCKGKVQNESEMMNIEATIPTEEVVVTQVPVTEGTMYETTGQESIPPTASVPVSAGSRPTDALSRSKDIQSALKAAGFYAGSIDGKIGPKTKKAIIEFQRAKGLATDGKVGPKTWAELEKYLYQ